MSIIRIVIALIGITLAPLTLAATPQPGNNLPPLTIEQRGELYLEGEDINYRPWSSERNPGTVHIVQYLAGTRSASAVYRPFTDTLKETYDYETFHVTTIINLDDAAWGTSSFVVSEVEDNKRQFPLATMVLDEEGTGLSNWQLTKDSAALLILDKKGKILHFSQDSMSEKDMAAMLKLVAQQIDS